MDTETRRIATNQNEHEHENATVEHQHATSCMKTPGWPGAPQKDLQQQRQYNNAIANGNRNNTC